MSFKVILLLPVLFFTSCRSTEFVDVNIGDVKLAVEIVDTPETRGKGLMNRKELKSDHGMLFVFEQENQVSFWMKNTSIPLSIAYITKHGEIVEIYDLEPFSLESVTSKRSSILYALEVNRGYFNENSITVGDTINLEPVLDYLKSSR